VVEVVYRDEPRTTVGPFLKEERLLIDSLAEMLAAYLEHDIAERQRSQLETQLRQSQQMEALGTLAGGIAHDFNNLLTAIGGNAELALTEPSATSPVKEHLRELRKAHARATDLVKRILLFSRRQEADRRPVAPGPVIDEAVMLLRASLPKSIDIRCYAEPGLPVVLADASQIHQVIMNLGTNAAHAMGEQGGVLRINLDQVTIGTELPAPTTDLRPGPHVRISVSDTGTGMSPAIQARLFEPFFTTKGTAGTGLGLSVVHGIVTDHGGAITVESTVGHGSTFYVYLPAAEGVEAHPPKEEVVLGHGEHIMYVDDEETLVSVMTRLLNRLGYRSTGYSDADEALQAFRTNPEGFHAVITDMAMPRMNGARLAHELRALRPGVPVAIASGYEGPEMEAAGRAGITRIAKPISMETLSQTVRAMLQGKVR
jgi:signal transduction histidine kinase/ActR/RegA family two-component response regulator